MSFSLDVLLPWGIELARNEVIGKELTNTAYHELTKAKASGEKGVLLRITKVQVQSGVIVEERIWGNGVEMLGAGVNPTSVCVLRRCWERLDVFPSSSYRFTDDSDFVWYSFSTDAAGKEQIVVERYRAGQGGLDEAANFIHQSANAVLAMQQAAWGEKLEFFARDMANRAQAQKDRDMALALLQSREKAPTRVRELDEEIARQAGKARKAARTQGAFEALSGVLTLASNTGVVSYLAGEPVGGNQKDVADKLTASLVQANTLLKNLTDEQVRESKAARSAEQALRNLDVAVKPSEGGSFTRPKLN
jgi:hypothetical protein